MSRKLTTSFTKLSFTKRLTPVFVSIGGIACKAPEHAGHMRQVGIIEFKCYIR